jgi:Protein of unknown function (DUF1997)
MQASSAQQQSTGSSTSMFRVTSAYVEGEGNIPETTAQGFEPMHFRGHYASCMAMQADAQTVIHYLNNHRDWFHRCAHPMTAVSLGESGYDLTVGRFGAFSYEVEPKIGLNLLPQDQQGVYRIETIPIPGYEAPGYEVNFQAAMHLVEADGSLPTADAATPLTNVEWELDLEVTIQFPRFIQALPKALVQSTGDRLLNQIVRQASRCLTHKVQQDFHTTHNIAVSKQLKKQFWQRG